MLIRTQLLPYNAMNFIMSSILPKDMMLLLVTVLASNIHELLTAILAEICFVYLLPRNGVLCLAEQFLDAAFKNSVVYETCSLLYAMISVMSMVQLYKNQTKRHSHFRINSC